MMHSHSQKGFSLIEVAIGILILGGILTSVAGVYQMLSDTRHQATEADNIDRINQSINTYLAVNAYLPCPDTDTDPDGVENRTVTGGVSVCDSREGGLPYSDLGLPNVDSWGNPYYYRVHQRAESSTYINRICEPASVLGLSGARDNTDLWFCPDSNMFFCSTQAKCNLVCTAACTDNVAQDPRPTASLTSPPYFHLATRPYGAIKGDHNIIIRDEEANQLGEGVVAVVVSWGANGKEAYRDVIDEDNCVNATVDELANCDGDREFVQTRTGEDRDFVTWVTVGQAKVAIIGTGEFR